MPELTAEALQRLNAKFETADPTAILRWAVETFRPAVALTSSFGADSAALLHMAVSVDPRIEIRTVDTGVLFPETYEFIEALRKRLDLNLVVTKSRLNVKPFLAQHAGQAPGTPGFCCEEYKVEAMERALAGVKCWITGLQRSEAATRATTPIAQRLDTGVVKVAPIATWTAKQVYEYMKAHDLPFHPLWAQGYTSIGCWPCTVRPVDPNDPRSGRWAGQDKTECGIHDIGQPPPA
jgi:phosphoadenosine phosphosulfate reductase